MKKRCFIGFSKVPGHFVREELVQMFREHDIELKVQGLGRWLTEDEMIREIKDVDAAVAGAEPYTARVIDSANKLKIIQRLGVGYDKVDIEAATRKGIFVGITPMSELSKAVADEAFTLILSTLRMIPQMNRHVRDGYWDVEKFDVLDAYPLTLGILGLGKIGTEVARRARLGFDMKVLYHDSVRKENLEREWGLQYVAFEDLLRKSDILSIHIPLNGKTKGMIGEREISIMKQGAFLINTARGPIVDEEALYNALEREKLGGAGLGVLSKEPPTPECPFYKLGEKLPNVVLIPHTGAGAGSMRRLTVATAEGVIAVLEGRKPKAGARFVNPELLERIPLKD